MPRWRTRRSSGAGRSCANGSRREREFLIWKSGLEADRRAWEAAPEKSKYDALLMGFELAQAQGWLAERAEDLPTADREFIALSVAARRGGARGHGALQAAIGVLLLGTIAGLLGVVFKDEIGELWFEHTTVRRYIAAKFTPTCSSRTPSAR